MKKILMFLVMLVTVLTAIGCKSNSVGFVNHKYFEDEYNITNSTTELRIINMEEFEELKSSQNQYIIAVSRPTCDYCKTTIPRLIEASNTENISVIYFLNTEKLDPKDKTTLAEKYAIEGVPTLYFKSTNKLETIVIGDSSNEEILSQIKAWKGIE